MVLDMQKAEAMSVADITQVSAMNPSSGSATSQNPARTSNPTTGPAKGAQSPVALGPYEGMKATKPCKLGCGQAKHALEDCPVVQAGPLA
jgi:hypothetical protein